MKACSCCGELVAANVDVCPACGESSWQSVDEPMPAQDEKPVAEQRHERRRGPR